MTRRNIDIVKELLEGATDSEVVNRLMAENSVYVSLTWDNPDLRKLMPWAGTHRNGREGLLSTFRTLNTFWRIDDFTIRDIFGDDENVAVFGSFTVHSVNLDKIFVSPFAVHAKLQNELVTYMIYMEDTLGTGSTFRESGTWIFAGDPSGVKVSVGD